MKTVKDYAAMAEAAIRSLDYSNSRPSNLFDPIEYALKGGGKRLRPVLLLAVADALGANPDNFKNAAVAIEMFHNFTLIHDDIMDHADTRHGKPAVHAKWGEATAILSGDLMLTLSNIFLSDNNSLDPKITLDLIRSFSMSAVKVYRGQQFDLDFENNPCVSVEDYMLMTGLKTSALIGGACHLGAICAGADAHTRNHFYEYGYALGNAFQLQDDLLDTFGDETSFGKKIGGDIENDKKTWLYIMAMKESPERMDEAKELTGEEKIAAVRAVYESLDLRKRCEKLIEHHTNGAIKQLDKLQIDAEATEFFTNFALSLVGRKA